MHVISWCPFLFLIFIKIIEALNYADFGLPTNRNACTFTLNQTVYIVKQQESLSISFGHPWNTTTPSITKHNITTTTTNACSITKSGKLILIPQMQPINDITLQSWNLNSNITYLGSQNAIDKFITTNSISNFATATFNNYLIFFGGNDNTNTKLQSTFILDTLYDTLWTWYELPFANATPPPTSYSTLYATSRWILHFRIESTTTYIDCFDPYSFEWLGTISSFNTNSTNIQAVPVKSSSLGSESLLLITPEPTSTWKLDISTWSPNVTLTKLNPSSSQQHISDGAMIVTLDDDTALFYGGQQQQLDFFNTASLAFLPQPAWLNNTADINNTTVVEREGGPNNLAVILGSVMGSVLFIALVILFVWCYCIRKKRSGDRLLRPNNNENKPSSSTSTKKTWLLLGNRKPKTATDAENNDDSQPITYDSSDVSNFTLSPIKRLSPIILFPLPSDEIAAVSSSSAAALDDDDEDIIVQQQQQQQQQQPPQKMKSRFREHFDYHSFPLVGNHDNALHITPSKSLPLESTSTTTEKGSSIVEEQPSQIPRSVSSYV